MKNPSTILIFTTAQTTALFALDGAKNEDFLSFFYKFSLDESFQLERIHFPLPFIYRGDDQWGDPRMLNGEISKFEWKHRSDYYKTDQSYRLQFYDSFNKQLTDTNERLIAWRSTENEIAIYHYFSRIKGIWNLIKIEDISN